MQKINSLNEAIEKTTEKHSSNSEKYGYLTGGAMQFKINSEDVLDCILCPINIGNKKVLRNRFRLNGNVISKLNASKLFAKQ